MLDRTTVLIDLFASIVSPDNFSLSPDGSTIAFTWPINGYSQIFTISTRHAAFPRRITANLANCTCPQWSPDSTRLVFVQNKAVWTCDADGTHAGPITDHPAGNSEPRWSPDGSRIAFYSRRRGWEHLWTIPAEGGIPVQITHGPFDGDDVAWSPNAEWLAFCSVREHDLATRGIYLAPAHAEANATADGGQELLISPQGAWSGAPHWSPDGHTIAYLSDQDGWFHVYLYDCASQVTRQLTQGEFEDGGPLFYNVDRNAGPVFSRDGRKLAFIRHRTGNFDLWVTDVQEDGPRRISQEDGHYRIVGWLPDGEQLAVVHDTVPHPPELKVISLEGTSRSLVDSGVAELNGDEFMAPEWVTYPTRDGFSIHAALLRSGAKPEDKARHPAILFLHGGPSFQFANFYYPLPELLAQAGYVVLAPNFRGSTGYGRAFRHANFGEWGHADALDVIDAAQWLQTQPFVDPKRIAVMGPSYGGYLTLAALTLDPELFCAGIDMYGDSEIAESYRHGDRYGRIDLRKNMGTPEENPDGYRRGSPLYQVEQIQAPILILHGQEDRLVVPLMSEKMVEALKIEGKYFESHFYAGEEHGFAKPENRQDAWKRVLNFLNRHCKGEN